MTLYILLVLACPIDQPPGHRDCVAVVDEVASVEACRTRYQEIKQTLPANMRLGFPECHNPLRNKVSK